MTRKLTSFAVITLIAMSAQAQIHFGVKAGLNLNSPSNLKVLAANHSLQRVDIHGTTGWFAGPTAEVSLLGLGVEGALLYSQADSKAGNDNTQNASIKQKYIDLPINIKASFGIGSTASVFVAAGPQFSLNITGGNLQDVLDNVSELAGSKIAYNKSILPSINVAVGVKLLKHLQASVGYNIALSDGYTLKSVAGAARDLEGGKNNMFKAAVAVTF